MNTTLKPCPFCGGDARLLNYGHQIYNITCLKCGVYTCKRYGKDIVSQAWNARCKEI